MAEVINVLINNFSGGMVEDKRAGWVGSIGKGFTTNKFSLTKHFDIFSYPKKLVPYHLTEAEEDKTFDIVKFLYAPATGVGAGLYRLYGFGGVAADTDKPKIFLNNLDFTTGWQAATNGSSAVTNRNREVFFYYKDFIYMWTGGNKLVRFDTTGVAAFNDAYQTISYTDLAQPVHHPADDIAYFFQDNIVHELDGTTWTGSVLTLPSELKIVAACPYGNYLAIACATEGGSKKYSIVYLWDRDSSLATLTERIDFGEGEIRHLANLNNKLIAVMNFYVDSTLGLDRGRILIKRANGNFADILNEIIVDDALTAASTLPKTRMVKGNVLYFPTRADLNGDTRLGIWAVDDNGNISLDFIETEATSYEGIYSTGNMWWIAHSGDGSVNRSDDNLGYGGSTAPSIYESLIFNAGDAQLTKKLLSAAITTEPLSTGGAVILKYRKNEETSWTTIFTNTTDNSIGHTAINIESSGAILPEFKEIQFRIESYGNATTAAASITGLKFKVKIIPRDIAD